MGATTIEVVVQDLGERMECCAGLEIEILQNIQAVAWTVTPDGRMEFINRFYLDATGLTLEECLAPLPLWNHTGCNLPPFLTSLHPDHKERIRKIFWDGIRSGRGWSFEAPFFHRTDGMYHWHLDRAVPVHDRDGNLVRFVGTCADINELKQAEQKQLALAAENLKAYEEIACLKAKLERENTYLQEEIRREHNFDEILGNSTELLKLLDRVEAAAPTDANVLIIGETGSGKELIARAIHSRSARKNSPLVKVNCGAIPSGLVESELFGHVKGAFTSASERRIGRFELANNGTLFLDEVGELPLETQVKLLRVLQEQEFEPVGSNRTIKVNVRIIAATNRDLAKAVQSGSFRSDLYYRLNVIPLPVPPLRDRKSDIPEIVLAFLQQSAKRMGKPVQSVSQETMDLLVNYSWPGNIRELQNVIERSVVLSRGSILHLGTDFLPAAPQDTGIHPGATTPAAANHSLEDVQRRHILRVLERTGWVISGPAGAGAVLDLHPNTLRSLMHRLGIRRPSPARSSEYIADSPQ